MSLADELERLAALHEKGALSTEEFIQAKARLFSHDGPVGHDAFGNQSGHGQAHRGPGGFADTAAGKVQDALAPIGRLRRSQSDRWLGGICGGIARATGMASWIWRLVFSVLFLLWGTGILLYILLWIFMPDD